MSELRLAFLPRSADAPIVFRVVGAGAVAPAAAGDRAQRADLPTVAVVPGEDCVARWLTLPGGRSAQAAAAAGYLLDDELAGPREALHIAVGPPESDGRRLAIVVDRGRMRAWMAALAAEHVEAVAMAPDYLLIPEPTSEAPVAVPVGDDMVAVRGGRLALTCDQAVLSAVAQDARAVDAGEADRLLALGAAQPVLDLRQGDFAGNATGGGRPRFSRLQVLAVLAALILVAAPAAEIILNHLAARQAEARAETLAGPGDGAPTVRLRQKLERLQASERFPVAVAALFAAVEGIEGMELQGLLYDEQGDLRTSIAHANYSDTEVLRSRLAGAGLTVEESSAMNDGGRIVSDLVLRFRR